MRVVVMDPEGQIIGRGEWNGKTVDSFYAKVGDEIYNLAYVWLEEHEKEIQDKLLANKKEKKEVHDRHMTDLYTFRNKYGAR